MLALRSPMTPFSQSPFNVQRAQPRDYEKEMHEKYYFLPHPDTQNVKSDPLSTKKARGRGGMKERQQRWPIQLCNPNAWHDRKREDIHRCLACHVGTPDMGLWRFQKVLRQTVNE